MGDRGFKFLRFRLDISITESQLSLDFVDFLYEFGLEQTVQEPAMDHSPLDLFLSSNSTLVNRTNVLPGLSDHDAVFVQSLLSPTTPPPKNRAKYLFTSVPTGMVQKAT